MIVRIPNCCAMPHISKPGDVYDCLTCGARYRFLRDIGWTLDGPLVEYADELWAQTLDERERHGD